MFNDNTSPCIQEAINHLCLHSYLRFKCRVQRLHEYNVGEITPTHRVVKSTRYQNAPPHYCLKEDGAAYLLCNKYEASIAYDEQCEHSIVANDRTFVKSHFRIRHTRRDKQRGSYPDHLNQNQSPDNDDTNVSEETASEAFVTNKEVEDDSHWEDLAISDQSSEGDIKPLSTRDLQTVFNDIMSKFDKCQDNVKYLVSLLAILMQQVSATDGKQGGILETSPQTNCEVMQEMK